MNQLKLGGPYEITVRRNGQDIRVKNAMLEKDDINQYIFQLDPQATPQQIQLREAGLRNLYGTKAFWSS